METCYGIYYGVDLTGFSMLSSGYAFYFKFLKTSSTTLLVSRGHYEDVWIKMR